MGGWHSPIEKVELRNEPVTHSSATYSPNSLESPEEPLDLQAAITNTGLSLILDGCHSPKGSIKSLGALTNTETSPQKGSTFVDELQNHITQELSIPSLCTPSCLLKFEVILTPCHFQTETPTSATGSTPYTCWIDQSSPDPASLIGTTTSSYTPIRSVEVAADTSSIMMNLEYTQLESSNIHGEVEKICEISQDDVYSVRGRPKSRGDLHYARLLKLHASDYAMALHTRKKSIVKRVVSAVIQRGGRFIKLSGGNFVCMNEKTVHNKVAAALRSAASKQKKPEETPSLNESLFGGPKPPTNTALSAPTIPKPSKNSHVEAYKSGTDPEQQAIAASVSLSPGLAGIPYDVLEPLIDDIGAQYLSMESMDDL